MRWCRFCGFVLVFCISTQCYAMGVLPNVSFTKKLLAKAEIDECYNGVGKPFIPGPVCSAGEKPKANQNYLWGLAKSGDDIWIATGSNILCLMDATTAFAAGFDLPPLESDLRVCEYNQGRYLSYMGEDVGSNIFSDFRPPRIYTYNLVTRQLVDKGAQITDPELKNLLDTTYGFRSAVVFHNLVFIGGPSGNSVGVHLFVFDAASGTLIAAKRLTEKYRSVRRWAVLNDALYTAVSTADGGRVLRWTGSADDPFSFEEVGVLDNHGAEIVAHNGRLYVGTWPNADQAGNLPGLWMSPAVPAGGLTAGDADGWKKVWQSDQYEPDPIMANIFGMGAMASYRGKLYWGTMHAPVNAALNAVYHHNIGIFGIPAAISASWRTASIFRGSNFENGGEVELLYGEAQLPVYVPSDTGGRWENRPNNMGGVAGKFGASGFDNVFNNYIWTMAVYKDQLFVGTLDNSYLWGDRNKLTRERQNNSLIGPERMGAKRPVARKAEFGADLWRFPSDTQAAVLFTRDGLGNFTNYGFRTMISDESGLYVGTANPANIAQDDSGNPIGGWELIRVVQATR